MPEVRGIYIKGHSLRTTSGSYCIASTLYRYTHHDYNHHNHYHRPSGPPRSHRGRNLLRRALSRQHHSPLQLRRETPRRPTTAQLRRSPLQSARHGYPRQRTHLHARPRRIPSPLGRADNYKLRDIHLRRSRGAGLLPGSEEAAVG